MKDTYEAAYEALEKCLDAIYRKAYEIVEAHWAIIRAEQGKRPGWKNKSSLHLRCEQKGNAIRIDWTGIKWVGSRARGTRKWVRVGIKKPRGAASYSLAKLYEFANEWEKPIIADTEQKLAQLRREAAHLVKATISIRHAAALAGVTLKTSVRPWESGSKPKHREAERRY